MAAITEASRKRCNGRVLRRRGVGARYGAARAVWYGGGGFVIKSSAEHLGGECAASEENPSVHSPGSPPQATSTCSWPVLQGREAGGFGKIFYRRRRRRVKRKSGNLDDFCRRWGGDYKYMVVLDADSVMSGECLTSLVRLMEATPDAGIIQTAPRASGMDTLYARMQQFATRVYGPLFTAGLHF